MVNIGKNTEREPKDLPVAPQADSTGTSQTSNGQSSNGQTSNGQTSNGQTSNGQTAGSQHQRLLGRPSAHACKNSSPLCQSTLAGDM